MFLRANRLFIVMTSLGNAAGGAVRARRMAARRTSRCGTSVIQHRSARTTTSRSFRVSNVDSVRLFQYITGSFLCLSFFGGTGTAHPALERRSVTAIDKRVGGARPGCHSPLQVEVTRGLGLVQDPLDLQSPRAGGGVELHDVADARSQQ